MGEVPLYTECMARPRKAQVLHCPPFGPVHWKLDPDHFPLAPQKGCFVHISNPGQVVHAVIVDVFHAACGSQNTRSELGEIILLKHFI